MQIPGFRSALCKQLGTQLMVPMEDHLSVELWGLSVGVSLGNWEIW